MQKLTRFQVKRMPLMTRTGTAPFFVEIDIAKHLRFAVQHFLSIHEARMRDDDNLVSAMCIPAIREALSIIDSQRDLCRIVESDEFALVVFDAAQIAVFDLAIVEWSEELSRNSVPRDTEMWHGCRALIREYGNAEWRNA